MEKKPELAECERAGKQPCVGSNAGSSPGATSGTGDGT